MFILFNPRLITSQTMSVPRQCEDQPTEHIFCCASVTANNQFKNWIHSLPTTLHDCGISLFASKKIHDQLKQICHPEDRIDCGKGTIFHRAAIDQINERISINIKLQATSGYLKLAISVPETFVVVESTTPISLQPL